MKIIRIILIILTGIVLIVGFLWYLIFRGSQNVFFKMSVNAVATHLMTYKENFDHLPPTLDILCKEIPESKKMVYLGYRPWPLSGLNGESLLYNSTPQDDPENPLANVLVAAPISAGGERVVAFYRDYSADEYRIHYIKEREFSKYWTTNEKKELVWRKEE